MSECRREIGLDALTEDWAAVKRNPDQTGLSRAVWITENQGYPHDVRVKVSRSRSGRGCGRRLCLSRCDRVVRRSCRQEADLSCRRMIWQRFAGGSI